ncbi:hypothetical protein YW7DRAFT_00138 [Streptomyces sp. AmelKG-E11A]|nr:hypothetical protein YW7DRAFT_00138 [Streptomyces sp. AmelKG-E11A]
MPELAEPAAIVEQSDRPTCEALARRPKGPLR